jgi:acyl carrier protein
MNRKPEDITPAKQLKADLGVDSLSKIELSIVLETEYHIDILDEDIEEWRTCQDVINYTIAKVGIEVKKNSWKFRKEI